MTEPIDLPGFVQSLKEKEKEKEKEIAAAEQAFIESEEEEERKQAARELAEEEFRAEQFPELAELASQRAEQIEQKRQAALERLRQAEETEGIAGALGEEFKAEQAAWEQEELAPQGYEAQIEREAQFVGDDTSQWNPEAKQRRKAKYICVGRNNKVTNVPDPTTYWDARQGGEKPKLPKLYYLSYVAGKGVRRNDLTRAQKERCLGLITPEAGPANRRELTLQGKRRKPSAKYTAKAKASGIAQPPRVIGCLVADDELGATRGDATPFRTFQVEPDENDGKLKPKPPPGYTEEVCVEEKFADWLQADHNLAEPVPSQTVTQTFRGGQAGNWRPWHFEISLFAFLFQIAGVVKMSLEQESAAIRELISQQLGDNAQGLVRLRQFFISPDITEEQLPSSQPYAVDLSKGLEFWNANAAEADRLSILANGRFGQVMDYAERNQVELTQRLEAKLAGVYMEPAAAPAAARKGRGPAPAAAQEPGAMPLELPFEPTPEVFPEPSEFLSGIDLSMFEGVEFGEEASAFPSTPAAASPESPEAAEQQSEAPEAPEQQPEAPEQPEQPEAAPGSSEEEEQLEKRPLGERQFGDTFRDPSGKKWEVGKDSEGNLNYAVINALTGQIIESRTTDPYPDIQSDIP